MKKEVILKKLTDIEFSKSFTEFLKSKSYNTKLGVGEQGKDDQNFFHNEENFVIINDVKVPIPSPTQPFGWNNGIMLLEETEKITLAHYESIYFLYLKGTNTLNIFHIYEADGFYKYWREKEILIIFGHEEIAAIDINTLESTSFYTK